MAETPLPINVAVNREVRFTDQECVAWAEATQCPVTFVHGSQDPRPAANALLLAEHIRTTRKRIVQGAGHMPWVEEADELRQVLAEAISAAR